MALKPENSLKRAEELIGVSFFVYLSPQNVSKGPICLDPRAAHRDDSGHRRLDSEAEFVDESFV